MSLLSPMIRNMLLDLLPPEIGLFIRSFPVTFQLHGDFDFQGTDMDIINADWHQSEVLKSLCEYSTMQMEMFIFVQKAMERTALLRSAHDLINYRRIHSKDAGQWEKLMFLWAQAIRIYCDKVIELKGGHVLYPTNQPLRPENFTIKMENFLSACDDLLRKRVN